MFHPRPDIYAEFISELKLSDEDRETLRVKRGFTDKTISELMFRSSGPAADDLIQGLMVKHGQADMVACGLWDEAKDCAGWQWADPGRVIIPYLDVNDAVLFLKSHRDGNIKGASPFPYCPKTHKIERPKIILCESEFKAAAMWQMGYRAIGLGGVSSFAGEHLGKLLQYLDKATDIIVFFDTEIQDNPAFKSYKEDYRNRYAQHIWAYILAKKIGRALLTKEYNPNVLIASLPEAWCIDGKADVDSCLAAGHTKEEFDKVLSSALTPEHYRYKMQVKKEHVPWINRRLDRAFRDTTVKIENNCYVIHTIKPATKGKPPEAVEKVASNFFIKIKHNVQRSDQVYKEIYLVNKYGDVSKPFPVTASDLVGCKSFKERCLALGDFLWSGTDFELNLIIQEMFIENDMNPLIECEYIGRDNDAGCWLFGNLMLKDDGAEITPDEDEICWDGQCGRRIARLSSEALPILAREGPSVDEIFGYLKDAWGDNGILAALYVYSCLFSDDLFLLSKSFPFLWIYGERESGKSTLSDFAASLLGFPLNHSAMNLSESTQVALYRKLAWYHSLPCRVDEYRTGDKKIESKNSALRSLYNRQIASKGTREGVGTREVSVSGNLIIVGEEGPSDPAMQTRVIPLYLETKNISRDSAAAMQWLFENSKKLSYPAYLLLKKYAANRQVVRDGVAISFKRLKEISDAGPRVAMHYAFLMSVLPVLFEDSNNPLIKECFRAIDAGYKEAVQATKSNTLTGGFFEIIDGLLDIGGDIENYVFTSYSDTDPHLYIHFSGAFLEYMGYLNKSGRDGSGMSRITLKAYLRSMRCLVDHSLTKRLPKNKKTAKVFVFNYKNGPAELLAIGNRLSGRGGNEEVWGDSD